MTNWPWNQPEAEQPDDVLDRALSAMRDEPVPDGPSGELVADTLAALERVAVDYERPIPLFRRVMTVRNLKISVCVLTTTAAALFLILTFTPTSPTFADAVKCLRKARTLSYVRTRTSATDPNREIQKVYYRDDGRTRMESSWDDNPMGISIADVVAERAILLNPKQKQATLGGTFGFVFIPDSAPASGWIQMIIGMVDNPTKELDEKELDGKEVKGFFWSEGDEKWTIWIDKTNSQPVLVEHLAPGAGGVMYTERISHIQINPDIDNAMFSTEVPSGYTVRQPKEPKDKGPVIVVKSNKKGVEDRIYGETDIEAGRERIRNLSKEKQEGVMVLEMSGNRVQMVNPPKQ